MNGSQTTNAFNPASDHGRGDTRPVLSSSPLLCLGRAESGAGLLSPTNVRWSARSASGEATTTVPYGVSRPERSLNSPKRSPGALPILGRELDFGDIGISHSADVAPRTVDQAGLPPRPVHSPLRKVGHGASRHTLTGDGLLRALSEDTIAVTARYNQARGEATKGFVSDLEKDSLPGCQRDALFPRWRDEEIVRGCCYQRESWA